MLWTIWRVRRTSYANIHSDQVLFRLRDILTNLTFQGSSGSQPNNDCFKISYIYYSPVHISNRHLKHSIVFGWSPCLLGKLPLILQEASLLSHNKIYEISTPCRSWYVNGFIFCLHSCLRGFRDRSAKYWRASDLNSDQQSGSSSSSVSDGGVTASQPSLLSTSFRLEKYIVN